MKYIMVEVDAVFDNAPAAVNKDYSGAVVSGVFEYNSNDDEILEALDAALDIFKLKLLTWRVYRKFSLDDAYNWELDRITQGVGEIYIDPYTHEDSHPDFH